MLLTAVAEDVWLRDFQGTNEFKMKRKKKGKGPPIIPKIATHGRTPPFLTVPKKKNPFPPVIVDLHLHSFSALFRSNLRFLYSSVTRFFLIQIEGEMFRVQISLFILTCLLLSCLIHAQSTNPQGFCFLT